MRQSVFRRSAIALMVAVLPWRGSALTAEPQTPPKPAGPQPLRPGDVAFSTEIAPVLLETCTRCHGETENEGGLRMHTLQALLSGKVVTPGKGGASLLVKKLRGAGIEGQRMPLNRPPLADAVIARIEKWIDQGAKNN